MCSGTTDKRWLAGVVDVEQVALEIQVAVPAELHGSVRGLVGNGTGWEIHLGKEAERCEGHARQAPGCEFRMVDDDFLYVRM